MREIKFRRWNKLSKRMGVATTLQGWMLCATGENKSWIKHWNNGAWMQYTGLKDKNGKEIYEGDIVKEIWSNHVVSWSEGDCGFLPFINNKTFRNWEVIGNIYENPELL